MGARITICAVAFASLVSCLQVAFAGWPAVKLAAGYIIIRSSVSPSGRYGVIAFDNRVNEIPEHIDNNKLIDLHNGNIIAELPSVAITHENRGGILPGRWSADSSLLLWEVEGRWSPSALTLLKIQNSEVKSELDLLKTAQQVLLVRSRSAAPETYDAAKERNKGNGSAFPDGFNVNVRVEGDKERDGLAEDVHGLPISLPLKIHAELTSNPKQIEWWPEDAQLDSELDGVVTDDLKFRVTRFRLRQKPFPNATSSSYFELTNPAASAKAPFDYGDVVFFQGRISRETESANHFVYILTLDHAISVRAAPQYPSEEKTSTIRLLQFDRWGDTAYALAAARDGITFHVWGTLGQMSRSDGFPPVTLNVQSYEYRPRRVPLLPPD